MYLRFFPFSNQSVIGSRNHLGCAMSPIFWKTIVRPFCSGAAITLGSMVISCTGALVVEWTAHRTLFHLFPHWYSDVEYAFGLKDFELAAVRGLTKIPGGQQEQEQQQQYQQQQQQQRQELQVSLNDSSDSIVTFVMTS